jgi:hypothetical protein
MIANASAVVRPVGRMRQLSAPIDLATILESAAAEATEDGRIDFRKMAEIVSARLR